MLANQGLGDETKLLLDEPWGPRQDTKTRVGSKPELCKYRAVWLCPARARSNFCHDWGGSFQNVCSEYDIRQLPEQLAENLMGAKPQNVALNC